MTLAGILAASGAWAGPRADQQAAQAGLARIDSLLAVGRSAEAVALAARLAARLGDDPAYGWQIAGRRGLALLQEGRAEEAIPHLEEVILRQPREPAHHRNLGAALLQLGRRGRALSEFQVAVELAPDDADLRREYGQMLLAFRDTRRAARELLTARRLCGGCPEVDPPLASLHILERDFVAAVPVLRRIHAREPSAANRRTLVAALAQAGADSGLVAFLAAGPGPARTADEWRLLVEAEGRLGDPVVSRETALVLGATGPAGAPAAIRDDARFWGRVALNLSDAGEPAAALPAVDRAVELAPDDVVHRNNRVVILTALGRDADARAEWKRVQELDPTRTEEP